jgi:hypothetical protein
MKALLTIAGIIIVILVLAMAFASENGIEKPYRDLVRNTGHLQNAVHELERVSQTIFMGQVLFGKYLEVDASLETQLEERFTRIDEAGMRALEAVNKI